MKRFFVAVLLCCLLSAASAWAKGGMLLVAFGTSVDKARPAIDAVVKTCGAQADGPVLLAFTSDIIRKKLAAAGENVPSVNAALRQLADQGVDEVLVQSLHIAPAEEYSQLERMIVRFVTKNPGVFKSVKVGYPLLVSENDLNTVVSVVLDALPERRRGDAVVLMGHGNDRGPGDLVLAAAATAFHKADPLVWLATVEGSNSFDRILPQLRAAGVKRVWLQPFMLVAGDHAVNDLAGPEEDSWASRIRAEGMTPLPHLVGLGEIEGIRRLFLEHARHAVIDLAAPGKAE